MRGNNRKSIEKFRKKLPQFTTMNVIDGQAGLIMYTSLIFYSLTIDNILNIIVLLILAGVGIATLAGDNGILAKAQKAKDRTVEENLKEELNLSSFEELLNKYDENSDFVSELEDLNVVGMNKFTWYKDTHVTVADVIVLKDGIYYNIIDNGGNFEKVEKIDQLREEAVVLYKWMCDDTADMEFIGEDSLIYNGNKYWIFETETSEFIELYVESEQEILDRKALKIKVNTGDDGIVELPIEDLENCTIDWGDGEVESYPVASSNLTQNEEKNIKIASIEESVKIASYAPSSIDHEYIEKNVEKTVVITGEVKYINSNLISDDKIGKIIEIEQWGETGLQKVYLGYCENLRKIASPTEKSFENMTEFDSTFSGCTSLTEIPEDLFANCPNVTSFCETFYECTSLTQIPENLFANCQNVTSFEGTFYNCTSLTGEPIELWTRGDNSEENYYQGTPKGGCCYYNCTRLNGYESIPRYWKQETIVN